MGCVILFVFFVFDVSILFILFWLVKSLFILLWIGLSIEIVKFVNLFLSVENCWFENCLIMFLIEWLDSVVNMFRRFFVFGFFFNLFMFVGSKFGLDLVFLNFFVIEFELLDKLIFDWLDFLDLFIFVDLLCKFIIWVVGLVIKGLGKGKKLGVLKLLLNFWVIFWFNLRCCFWLFLMGICVVLYVKMFVVIKLG